MKNGQHQIQQNERIGVKGFRSQKDIDRHPNHHHGDKAENECPAARKPRHRIRRALTEGRVLLTVGVLRDLGGDQLVNQLLIRKLSVGSVQQFTDNTLSFRFIFHDIHPLSR